MCLRWLGGLGETKHKELPLLMAEHLLGAASSCPWWLACSSHVQSCGDAKIFTKRDVERHYSNVIIDCYGSYMALFWKENCHLNFISQVRANADIKIFFGGNKYFFSLSCYLCVYACICLLKKLHFSRHWLPKNCEEKEFLHEMGLYKCNMDGTEIFLKSAQ